MGAVVTFLDYPDGRDEYIRERLLDADDIAAWRAEQDVARPSQADMVRRWADERAERMGEYDAREWGWWDSHDDAD